MQNVGWEIKPIGYVAIVVLAGFTVYFTISLLRKDKKIKR